MMERLLPQRFCPPLELGNPQKTRVSTFPQRRRLLLSNWTQLLNPRKSNVSTDSRPEPNVVGQLLRRFKLADDPKSVQCCLESRSVRQLYSACVVVIRARGLEIGRAHV